MRARRALLYMPGDDMRKIQKATTLGVDCICMDMEDGVALNRKGAARAAILEALLSMDFGPSERLARINPIGSGLETEDLHIVLEGHPDGIVLPKVESAASLGWADVVIAGVEKAHGWTAGGIGLIAIVETARGIVNLAQIAAAAPRLQALIFGAEDLAGDMGMTRTPEGWEVFYARSAVVTYAAAFNLQAIDQVYVDFHDTEGLMREAAQGARMGFAGKQVIHPNQVAPVQEAFIPSEEELARAKAILAAAKAHQAAGTGAFALDGRMVDAPVVKAAERVIARARAAGD